MNSGVIKIQDFAKVVSQGNMGKSVNTSVPIVETRAVTKNLHFAKVVQKEANLGLSVIIRAICVLA